MSFVGLPALSVTVLSDACVKPPAGVKPKVYVPIKPVMPRPANVATPSLSVVALAFTSVVVVAVGLVGD